jgi:hypothetical protein
MSPGRVHHARCPRDVDAPGYPMGQAMANAPYRPARARSPTRWTLSRRYVAWLVTPVRRLGFVLGVFSVSVMKRVLPAMTNSVRTLSVPSLNGVAAGNNCPCSCKRGNPDAKFPLWTPPARFGLSFLAQRPNDTRNSDASGPGPLWLAHRFPDAAAYPSPSDFAVLQIGPARNVLRW